MSSMINRRNFLGGATAAGMGIAISGSVDILAGGGNALAAPRSSTGYGPLVPDPAGILALPAGFTYRIVSQSGVTQTLEGAPTPSDPDGSGVFSRDGVDDRQQPRDRWRRDLRRPAVAGLTYDPGARGGTTNIEVDAQGNRVVEYTSVAGTHNNCAGGVSPWATWLTCEETEQRKAGVFQQDHGYVFEVDPVSQQANLGNSPVPLKFLGRFAHEAVAVDPTTSAIYETEDATGPNGLYLRWTPPEGFTGGRARCARWPWARVVTRPGGSRRCAAPVGASTSRTSRWRPSRARSTRSNGWTCRTGSRHDVGSKAVRRRRGHAQPQARGRVVG